MKKIVSAVLSFIIVLSAFLLPSPLSADAAIFNVDVKLHSKSVYLENLDTETVVFEKEANARRFPASTTKIMTYIITAENVNDYKKTYVTVKERLLSMLDGTGSSVAGIKAGEKLSIYQLLCCLMIPSGNDAALILADYVGKGSIEKFVDMMNAKAKELYCTGTHFANPHGLNDPNHFTTVADMAKITKYAMTLPEFNEISNMTESDCLGEDRYLITTNHMIDELRGGDYYYEYASGIKTGATGNDSGYCLVSTAAKDGYTYLCVAYGAPYEDKDGNDYDNGAMIDSVNLYEWVFDNLSIKTILDKNELVKEVRVNFAWNKDSIQLVPAKGLTELMPYDVNIESIDKKYNVPEQIDAPVKSGDKIGTVTLSYANQQLATVDLLAGETVERSDLLTAADGLKKIASSKWFIITASAVVALVLIYIIIVAVYNRRKKTYRPVKKYRKF